MKKTTLFTLGFICIMSLFTNCDNNASFEKGNENPLTSTDIEALAQKHLDDLDISPISQELLGNLQNQFFNNYLLPWNIDKENLNQFLNHKFIPGKDSNYTHTNFLGESNEWFGEHKQAYSEDIKQKIADNVNLENFPNFYHKGITVNHTDLRRIPTYKPGFDTYSKAGEGFPFDYFQETGVWANSPILLLHITEDRQWVYSITSYYKGWIPFKDLAIVDNSFIGKWASGKYGFILSDHVPIKGQNGIYGLDGRIGMILPTTGLKNNQQAVQIAIADENRKASLRSATIDANHIQEGFQQLSASRIKQMIKDMIGQPYGWGGYLQNRDCSATIRDLLAPAGIWLPRNSTTQAIYGKSVGGQNIDLEKISSQEEKLKIISEKGIPFLTIVWKSGHSMLYIGKNANDEPLILHTIWGLKTAYQDTSLLNNITNHYPIEGIHKSYIETENGQSKTAFYNGRRIIGKTIITTLTFDEVYTDLKSRLIDDLVKMTILSKPGS